MNSRLEKMFEESRKRHSKKNTQVKEKKEKIKEEVIKAKERKKQSAELRRAKNLVSDYKWHDVNTHGFNDEVDFDGQWIVDNIFDKGCIYCGETDWRKLGCDRIDNTKPHTKDNVVPCCTRCNKLRSNKFTVDEMKEIGAVIKRIENRHKDYCLRRSKKVASYDKEGNLVKEYKAASQVQEDGLSPKVVRRACQFYDTGYTYKGMFWKYTI